ncbi:MAG: transposase [Bacteroidales bacterium]|nr:transposase [Bacteroidales bacterium]MBQ9587555.1 transposase [Bacteroidales bacterium]
MPDPYHPLFLEKKKHVDISTSRLPHWHQDHKVQFVTFRLADSLPQEKINEYKSIKKQWTDKHPLPWDNAAKDAFHNFVGQKIDYWIDQGYGSCILKEEKIRKMIVESLMFYDNVKYFLYHYVIMPNHVHLLASPIEPYTITEVIGRAKQYTAKEINKLSGHHGPVWQHSMFDRMVRDENDFDRYVNYINNNPNNLPIGTFTIGGRASLPDQGKKEI